MKRIWTLLTAALLAAALLLTATGCSLFGGMDIEREGEYTISVSQMNAFSDNEKTAFSSASDDSGLVVVYEEKEDGVDYYLLDLTTGSIISTTKWSVRQENLMTTSGIQSLSRGLFYATEKNTDGETEITIFTRNGKTDLGEATVDGEVITAKDGTRTYVDVKGELKTEPDEFKKIAPYGAEKVGDYYAVGMDVFNADGEYLYSMDLYELGAAVPENAETGANWTVGNYGFQQFLVEVPEDSKNYDVFYEGKKADVLTLKFNMKNGDISTVSMDYIIEEQELSINDDCVALSCYAIENQTASALALLQTFDADGDVAVDLQDLVPGAVSIRSQGAYLVIEDGTSVYLFEGNDELYAASKDESASYAGSIVKKTSDTAIYLFDLKDNLVRKIAKDELQENNSSGTFYNGNLWFATKTELIVVDVTEKNVQTLFTLDQYTTVVAADGSYLVTKFDSSSVSGSIVSAPKFTVYFVDAAKTTVEVVGSPSVVASSYDKDTGTSYRVLKLLKTVDGDAAVPYFYLVKTTKPVEK